MAKARTLNIPVYEATWTDGDVIDAEHVDTHETKESRAQRRERRRDARENSPRAQRMRKAREQAARDQALRAQAAAGDPSAKLRLESAQAAMALINGLRRDGILEGGLNADDRKQKLSQWQKAYASTMVFHCLQPLSRGMKAHNVLEVVGMSAMLWMCSPVFRAQVGEQLQSIHEAVTSRIGRMGEDKARRKEANALDKGLSRDDIRRKWRKKLERAERRDRHGLPQFTAESAALMEMGVAEAAYMEMRQPDADVDAIMARHDATLRELYAMAEADGVTPAEIGVSMRRMVAARLQSDPQLSAMYADLAHGRFVHDGEHGFVEPGSGYDVDRGTFRVRRPMTPEQHVEAIAAAYRVTLAEAAAEGPEIMEAQMHMSVIGLQVGRYPEAVDAIENPVVHRQLTQHRAFFRAMTDDGYSLEDAQEMATGAFLGVVNEIAVRNPSFAQSWHGEEGARWRQRMSEQIRDFEKFGESVQAQMREQGQTWGDVEEPVIRVYDQKGRRMESDAQPDVDEVDIDIVDADIVEEWDEAMAKPFRAPVIEDDDPRFVQREFVNAMSDRFADDLVASIRRDGGVDPMRNAWLPQTVFGRSAEAFAVVADPSRRADSVLFMDDDAFQRAKTMVTMREELERVGMPAAQQDIVFAAAYVRALEKTIAREPAYEKIVQRIAGSPTGGGWQEIQFARALAQTRTSPTHQMSYFEYASSLDGDDLTAQAESVAANVSQMEQARDAFVRNMPQVIREGRFDVFSRAQASKRRQRRQQQAVYQGAINREHNADYKDGQVVDLDPGLEFNVVG